MSKSFIICDSNKCTGCSACFSICPKSCITMVNDIRGFKHPIINYDICVGCSSCINVCPSNFYDDFQSPHKCFAARNKDILKLKKSTSGGIAIEILNTFIKTGGVCYSTIFDSFKKEFYIKRFDSSNVNDMLVEAPGSKYVQTNVNNSFQMIRKDILNGLKICFISTPCQVAALRKYLSILSKNVFFIDFVCHGVPSQKMLFDHFKEIHNENVGFVSFRKRGKYYLNLSDDNNEIVYSKNLFNDKYLEGFLSNITLRSSCFRCNYAKGERVGDITIGDYWGLGNDSKFKIEDGVSMVLVNNSKGDKLISLVSSLVDFEERSLEEPIHFNSQFSCPATPHPNINRFLKLYPTKSFHYSIKKTRKLKTKMRYLPFLRKIVEKRYL